MDRFMVSKYAFHFLENTWKQCSLEHNNVVIKKEIFKKNHGLVVWGWGFFCVCEKGQARGMPWIDRERSKALYSNKIKPLTDFAQF